MLDSQRIRPIVRPIRDSTPGELRFLQSHRYMYERAIDRTPKIVIWVQKSFFTKEELLMDLCGTLRTVLDDLIVPGVNDFSIVYSSLQNRQRLWLGPAAYINHDCKSNCVIYSMDWNLACVRAIRVYPQRRRSPSTMGIIILGQMVVSVIPAKKVR